MVEDWRAPQPNLVMPLSLHKLLKTSRATSEERPRTEREFVSS
jgi:hypothetical protein